MKVVSLQPSSDFGAQTTFRGASCLDQKGEESDPSAGEKSNFSLGGNFLRVENAFPPAEGIGSKPCGSNIIYHLQCV